MATSREIINDLRAQAAAMERRGHDQLVTSLRRGAAEIERLLDDQFYMRAALDMPAETQND